MPLFPPRPTRQTGAPHMTSQPDGAGRPGDRAVRLASPAAHGGAPLSRRRGLGDAHVAPPPPAGSAASALLKRYRPLQTRASGGFGSVEICLDGRLQRRVAIKRMPLASPYNRTSTETTATALAEARTASMLQHVEICLDGRLQRRVAIKRMPLASPYNRTSTETTATALAEARTASMLQHPNIVQVIDFSYDSAYAYLVMEYVDGMSLEDPTSCRSSTSPTTAPMRIWSWSTWTA